MLPYSILLLAGTKGKIPWWQLTFGCFPVFIFSSNWTAARRTRFWRESRVKTVDQFYVRDKAGNVWFCVLQEAESSGSLSGQILGYPLDKLTQEKIREMFFSICCYARIDTEYRRFEKILFIHDIVIHPEYRRQNMGKFLFKEVINHYRKRQLPIKKISGRLGTRDEYGEEDLNPRDFFWKSLGFKFKKGQIKTIEADFDSLIIDSVKAYKMSLNEYLREIDFEIHQETITQQKQHISGLMESLSFERNKPCWLRLIETTAKCLSGLFLFFKKLFFLKSDK